MDPVDQLLRWAEEQGICLNGIMPRHLPGRGVGVIATRSIKVRLAPIFNPKTCDVHFFTSHIARICRHGLFQTMVTPLKI